MMFLNDANAHLNKGNLRLQVQTQTLSHLCDYDVHIYVTL